MRSTRLPKASASAPSGSSGLYLFHRGEERGGLGSRYIASTTPELLHGIRAAIAFDRRGTHSVITHQRGQRSASDAFAYSLADALGLGHAPDPTGTFTDTANYVDLIGECSNLSVGYENEHTDHETLDLGYLLHLRDALVAADLTRLTFDRRPGEHDPVDEFSWPAYRSGSRVSRKSLYDLVYDNPGGVADFLEHCGVGPEDLEDYLGMHPQDITLEDDPIPF